MASRIKGITVEIGGDTTGLDKALKQVNSTIRTTQSSLRDVNRLLKLDPKNTELLAQKQKMLKNAITATKEKLDTLKTAQEQAKAQLESGDLGQDKNDALQREIVETEQKLKGLQQEAINTNAVFSKMDAAGAAFTKAGDAITGAGQKIMPVSLAVGGLGALAVKTAGDFDEAMSKVSAISGVCHKADGLCGIFSAKAQGSCNRGAVLKGFTHHGDVGVRIGRRRGEDIGKVSGVFRGKPKGG